MKAAAMAICRFMTSPLNSIRLQSELSRKRHPFRALAAQVTGELGRSARRRVDAALEQRLLDVRLCEDGNELLVPACDDRGRQVRGTDHAIPVRRFVSGQSAFGCGRNIG